MSATWTFAQLVDLLKPQLEALPAILALDPVPEIRVSTLHLGEDFSDIIVLGYEANDEDKFQTALGSHSHDEEVTVGCVAEVTQYGSGDVEAKTARDRALTILDIIDKHLRETTILLGAATLRRPIIENRRFKGFPGMVGPNVPVRVAQIMFDITYEARTTP